MTKLETSAKKYDIRGESGAGGFWEQTNGPHIAGALLYTGDKTNPPSRLVSLFSLLRSSPLDAANFIIRPSSSPLFLRHFVMFIVHRGGEFLRRELKSAFGRLSLREEAGGLISYLHWRWGRENKETNSPDFSSLHI